MIGEEYYYYCYYYWFFKWKLLFIINLNRTDHIACHFHCNVAVAMDVSKNTNSDNWLDLVTKVFEWVRAIQCAINTHKHKQTHKHCESVDKSVYQIWMANQWINEIEHKEWKKDTSQFVNYDIKQWTEKKNIQN